VGSGVTDKNIKMLRVETGATSFHMSAKKIVISKMQFRKEGVNMGTENSSEYDSLTVDQEMIRNAKQILLSQ
jgi:copper homeostasis protein